MGALSIPTNIYTLPIFEELKLMISNKEVHWKSYNGDSTQRRIINRIIGILLDHHDFIKMNVIYYDQSMIKDKAKEFKEYDSLLGESTIYMKLPERIIYGLVRNYGKLSNIKAQIIIEEATEYKKCNVDLKRQLPKQLNMQAVYRGENFKIAQSNYAKKGEEIGLESTDVLLGMIRTIVTNPPFTSRKKKAQIELIINLLKDQRYSTFLKDIKYYEWTNSHHLTEVNFEDYLYVFINQNYNLFI